VLLLIGFVCGYGVRALISRRHRMKAMPLRKGHAMTAVGALLIYVCGTVLARGSRGRRASRSIRLLTRKMPGVPQRP
jgi:hypothetical protein